MDAFVAPATRTTQSSTAASPPREQAEPLSSDFNTFLQMLTTQMQNQDPLNPIESADFAVQLATFSGVEQQVRTNEILGDLGEQLAVMGLSQLAGWVGMDARVDTPVTFEGQPVELVFDVQRVSDARTLIVRDPSGSDVQSIELSPGADGLVWTGEGLDAGTYRLVIQSSLDGEIVGEDPVEHYARITEARQGTTGTSLELATGAQVSASDITAIRSPVY